MQRYLVTAAISWLLLNGCATPPPAAPSTVDPDQPSAQDSLNCKIEGLLFQDLARLRDAGQPLQVAVNRVNTQYQGLAASLEERGAVDFALARRDDSAKFVYAHRLLQPATLRYFGNNHCLAGIAGERDSSKETALARSAEECQKQYPPFSAEPQLRSCIADASAQLLAH